MVKKHSCIHFFVAYIKADDTYKDIAIDVETRIDTSNDKLDRPLPERKNINWINERSIRWNNYEKICWIKSKNLYLLKDTLKAFGDFKNKQNGARSKYIF